jgi:hypothetical protein
MRRGFKAEAERHAQALRATVGSSERESMDLSALAVHLGVAVLPVDDLLDGGLDVLFDLHAVQPGAFSAATFSPPGKRHIVVYNPINFDGDHVPARQARTDGRIRSNVAHEFAHLILGHDVRQTQKLGGHFFFTCNPEQEEEANWLGGALLLPRPLLLEAARAHWTDEQVADEHHVSTEMARFRMNATGARMQAARARNRQSP